MVDENDRIIYANSKMAEILDHSRDDLAGKEIGGLLPQQLWSMTQRSGPRRSAGSITRSCVFAVQSSLQQLPIGRNRVYETCIAVASLARANKCLYFQDLTKHIQVERELFSANSFLNSIIMSLGRWHRGSRSQRQHPDLQ